MINITFKEVIPMRSTKYFKKRILLPVLFVLILCLIACANACSPPNSQPVIKNLEYPNQIEPSATCAIDCNAFDADGDSLTYQWSALKGTISGQSSSAIWTAPAETGIYTLKVKVSDGNEGKTTADFIINVAEVPVINAPPTIVSLIAKPNTVDQDKPAIIKCVTSDPEGDDICYQWEATGGQISGQGDSIMWTAPNSTGSYFISVMITDGFSGKVTEQIPVNVVANHPPQIDELDALSTILTYGDTTSITCSASDPDGDELSYVWETTGGEITGEGATISWISPEMCTTYTVTATVMDNRDGEATEDITIRVRKAGG